MRSRVGKRGRIVREKMAQRVVPVCYRTLLQSHDAERMHPAILKRESTPKGVSRGTEIFGVVCLNKGLNVLRSTDAHAFVIDKVSFYMCVS